MKFNRNLLFLLLFSVSAISSIYTNSADSQECKELPADLLCSGVLYYNLTGFPNFLNHSTQEEALADLGQYDGLLQSNCSLALSQLLCALHLPLCQEEDQDSDEATADAAEFFPHLPPCRSLCRLGVENQLCLQEHGLVWLQEMDCEEFPDSNNSAVCLQPLDVLEPFAYMECMVSNSSGAASNQVCLTQGACYASVNQAGLKEWGCLEPGEVEPVCVDEQVGQVATACCHHDMCNQALQPQLLDSDQSSSTEDEETYDCRELGASLDPCYSLVPYSSYAVPNFLNFTSEADIQYKLEEGEPIFNEDCYEHAQFALCTVLTPKCDDSGQRLSPCRTLCQAFRSGCEPIFQQLFIEWPEDLDCENFPDSEDVDVCVGIPLPSTTAATTTAATTTAAPTWYPFTTRPLTTTYHLTTHLSSPVITTLGATSTIDAGACAFTEAEGYCENGGTCTLQLQQDGAKTPSCMCVDGYGGSVCQLDESTGTVDRNAIALGVGVSAAILLLIIIVVILFCFYKKRGKKSPYYSTPDNTPMFVNPAYEDGDKIAVISSKKLEGVYLDLDGGRNTAVYTKPSRLVQEVNVDLSPYQEEPVGSVYANDHSQEGEYVEPSTINMVPTAYQMAIGSKHLSQPPLPAPPPLPLPPANGTDQPLPSPENDYMSLDANHYQSLDGNQDPKNVYASLNDLHVETTDLGVI